MVSKSGILEHMFLFKRLYCLRSIAFIISSVERIFGDRFALEGSLIEPYNGLIGLF